MLEKKRRKISVSIKMAKTKKQPHEYELDSRKVQDVLKKLNIKKADNETLIKIAADLKFDLKSDARKDIAKKRLNHLRGKVLGAIRKM